MRKVATVLRIIDNINIWLGKIVGFLVIAITGILMYGVIMRYVFSQPIFWGGELSGILFIALVVLTGGYVLHQDSHVKIDAIYGRLSAKRKAIMDVATFIFFLFFMVLLTWYTIDMAWASTLLNERSSTYFHAPIYPRKICLALASLLLLLQGVARFIRNIGFITGHEIGGSA